MFARQNPGKRRVRFPDEVVFEDEIKEQDGMAVMDMLRRASIDIDINRINSAGQAYCTGFSSEIGTKLRDWAIWQAGGQLLLLGSIVLK